MGGYADDWTIGRKQNTHLGSNGNDDGGIRTKSCSVCSHREGGQSVCARGRGGHDMGRLRTQGTAGLWRRSSKEQSQASDQDLLPPAIILFAALPIRLKPAAWRGAAACRETPELSFEYRHSQAVA